MVGDTVQTQQQIKNMKQHSDVPWGIMYFTFFFLIFPFIGGGVVNLLYWARTDDWISKETWSVFGLLSSAALFIPLHKRIYGVNPAYTTSFWLDPFFGDKVKHAHDRLIGIDPGFYIRPFWWIFDSFTEHEKEVNIKLSGSFETFGEDTLNLEVKDANLVLRLPLDHARKLRAIAKGMKSIREELKNQLEPALTQAIAVVFAKHPPVKSLSDSPNTVTILEHQKEIAEEVQDEFEKTVSLTEKYGAEVFMFSLGDIGFSASVNNSREESFSAKNDAKAAKAWSDLFPELSSKDVADLVMMGKKGVKSKIIRISGISDEAAKAFGSAASVAKQFKK